MTARIFFVLSPYFPVLDSWGCNMLFGLQNVSSNVYFGARPRTLRAGYTSSKNEIFRFVSSRGNGGGNSFLELVSLTVGEPISFGFRGGLCLVSVMERVWVWMPRCAVDALYTSCYHARGRVIG